jgi:hypothetical protein
VPVLVVGLGGLEVEEGQAGAEGAVWVGRTLPVPVRRAAAVGDKKMRVWGEGKDWNGGTHGLGCKIGKLLKQIVFWG